MADIKFSQFTNTPTPNANSYFVGYNSVTGINGRTSLTDLITAIGAPSGSGTTDFISKWSGTNTLTDSLFYSDANVAKTVYGGNDKGIILDFANQVYFFGNKDNVPNQLYIDVNEIILGDAFNNVNSTKFIIDDATQTIKTQFQFADKGLLLDSANNQYKLGDYDGAINGTTLTVNDSTQIISLFSSRVEYTGQDSATIAAFTGNIAGQLAYNSDLNSFQYYNGSAWAAVAPKTTYMMVGMFTNLFGGDPGGTGKDILEWSGVATPAASHSSVLPILQDCKITAAGFKWISSSNVPVIGVGDSWNVQVFKMTNPLTGSTTADGNFTLVGNLNIHLDSANSGTTPGIFSSGLALTLSAGDIIRIAGVETGVIATGTEEAQLTVLFEVI